MENTPESEQPPRHIPDDDDEYYDVDDWGNEWETPDDEAFSFQPDAGPR